MFPRTYFAGTFFAPTYFPGEAQTQSSGVATATTYTFTGPTTVTLNQASTPYTVAAVGNLPGGVNITPAAATQTSSVFTPTVVALATGVNSSGTFTWTPKNTGVFALSVTNNSGLTNPANISVTVISGGSTSRLLLLMGVG